MSTAWSEQPNFGGGGISTLNSLQISLFEDRQNCYPYPRKKTADSAKRLVSIYQTTESYAMQSMASQITARFPLYADFCLACSSTLKTESTQSSEMLLEFQQTELFITTAVRTANPVQHK
jgi:hypothetical protein